MITKAVSKNTLYASIVSFLTFLLYMPAINNGFVNWDDEIYITGNTFIQTFNLQSIKWMFTSFHAANWHPLTWMSHAIDYAFWGSDPSGHHLTSIIIHTINTSLVVIISTRLVQSAKKEMDPGTCLIAGTVAGILFGLHPVHVESVAWVSERKDVLCALFFLLSINAYLNFTAKTSKNRANLHYGMSITYFLLAVLSKPMAVTLPVVLIILDIFPLERFTSGQIRRLLAEKIPFISLSVILSILTIFAQKTGGAISPLDAHSLGDRSMVAVKAFSFYLYKILWPAGLAPLYPYPTDITLFNPEFLVPFLIFFSVSLFCILKWKSQKSYSVLWLYYLLTLLPVIGIIQVGAQPAADRYTYLPSISPFILAGFTLSYAASKYKSRSTIILSIFIIASVSTLLSMQTYKQTKIWKDSLSLWNAELQIYPDFYRAYKNRGRAYTEKGSLHKAIADYNKAIDLNPLYSMAFIDRAISYAKLGNLEKALEDFTSSIQINPKDINAYYNRGELFRKAGEHEKALDDYKSVISAPTSNWQLLTKTLSSRGTVLLELGRFSAAKDNFERLIELDPSNARAFNMRGILHGNEGRHREALDDFDMAIKHDRSFVGAYNNRGSIYAMTGKHELAIKDFSAAIRIDPENADTYVNRGTLYLNSGNKILAIKDFQSAARLGDRKAQSYLKGRNIKW